MTALSADRDTVSMQPASYAASVIVLLASLASSYPAWSQEKPAAAEAAAVIEQDEAVGPAPRNNALPTDNTAASIQSDLATLQRRLEEQQKLVSSQQAQIERQQQQITEQQAQLSATSQLLTDMQSQIDRLRQDSETQAALDDEDVAMRERLAKLESEVGKMPSDPALMLADQSFPGSIRVPGTTASYKIGGFVKANIVKNFSPLVTQDRFIVGSIPVTSNDETALASEASLTANQTRVNFDYRQKSELGNLRAFVEGDFAGPRDTFRLRHAFGQFKDILAGKTWSTFYDSEAAPEQVDFEGINGRVVVRQTQIRYFPKIGRDLRLLVALEDPNPEVTGGEGVSDIPDFVLSFRRDWFEQWHVKTGILLRQIRAILNEGVDVNGQPCIPVGGTLPGDADPNGCYAIANSGSKVSDFGWGMTLSGNVQVPLWNPKDNFLFQLNYGKGLGRYITDLSSVAALQIDGGMDATVDPLTGEFKALPAFGGYLAFQHFWQQTLRSTFVISLVNVNNDSARLYSAYKQTSRLSGNLIWSPIPNVDIGAELLAGKRTNQGPDPVTGQADATSNQLQFEFLYRF